jgi:hypothetical protein
VIRELTTVAEFREAVRRHSIVITDSTGHRLHATPWACYPHVTEDNFVTKVIDHGGKGGRYFIVDSILEAEERWPSIVTCA